MTEPPKPEILTPDEIEALRQDSKERGAYFRAAFAHPRPKPEMLTPSEQASLRQHPKELSDFGQKAFAHLRKKPRAE